MVSQTSETQSSIDYGKVPIQSDNKVKPEEIGNTDAAGRSDAYKHHAGASNPD
jgi:hypothetical protein